MFIVPDSKGIAVDADYPQTTPGDLFQFVKRDFSKWLAAYAALWIN
jgi:hypothetical protein